jgi:hypothetical protein
MSEQPVTMSLGEQMWYLAKIKQLRKALALASRWMGTYPEDNESRARFFTDVQLVQAMLDEAEPSDSKEARPPKGPGLE